MRYEALIIGAGMSGLAAGIRLAQFGRRVAILEKHYLWGGLNSYYKLAGRRFDVGLHALTNYAPAALRDRPLNRILRQLRIPHADLALCEQGFSEIVFPSARLRFSNDFELLRSEIAAAFPSETGRFDRLVQAVDLEFQAAGRDTASRAGGEETPRKAARAVLAELAFDPLLAEMLLCPLCFYGSAREGDLDWDLFAILFRSVFQEGLARPEGGIRRVLDRLVRRYRDAGGELRMRSGVARIEVDGGSARGVVLEDGTELEAETVLSSAGFVETMRLCGSETLQSAVRVGDGGRISFLETISVLDAEPRELGLGATITFFNDSSSFDYRRPDGLCDVRSGVVSSPNNYQNPVPLPEGILRATCLANYDAWTALAPEDYAVKKCEQSAELRASAARFLPGFDARVVFQDVFTPATIARFTGHEGGSVYGSPNKRRTGETPVRNLFLCGTDQGLLGVVGALLSGITMANRWVLSAQEIP